MSTFEVNVVKIDQVTDHPDADRLSLNHIGGFVAISNKTPVLDQGEHEANVQWAHRYRPGDTVVYVPEDAVVPLEVLKKYNYTDGDGNGILAGSKGNRVKAIKLRGVVSQGLIFPLDRNMSIDFNQTTTPVLLGDNVAELLGIEKYQPDVPSSMSGEVEYQPALTIKFDVENLQKYPTIFTDGEPVIATEKLHGSFCGITFISQQFVDDHNIDTTSLTRIVEDGPNSMYFAVFSKGLGSKGLVFKGTDENRKTNVYLRAVEKVVVNWKTVASIRDFVSKFGKITIAGEVFGKKIQDLDYSVADARFAGFAIVGPDGAYLETIDMINYLTDIEIDTVPVVYNGPYDIDALTKLRDGVSAIDGKTIREGIVITPMIEGTDSRVGRRVLKLVSPDYLTRSGGTEFQ